MLTLPFVLGWRYSKIASSDPSLKRLKQGKRLKLK
jgi:hypothetical protein